MILGLLSMAMAGTLAQSLNQPVTFVAPAASVRHVLAELTGKVEVPLTVSGPIARDVICLRLEAVTLRDAMAKIAEATVAEWRPTKYGYTLERTAAAAEAYRESTRKKFEPYLSADLKRLDLAYRKTDTATPEQISSAVATIRRFSPEGEEIAVRQPSVMDDAVLSQTPGSRLLLRVAEGLGVKRLAQIAETGKKVVYATPATALQQPLTADQAIVSYVREHNEWSRAASEIDPNLLASRWRLRHFNPDQQTIVEGIGKVFVSVQSGRTPGSTLSFELQVFDNKGHWVDDDELDLLTGPAVDIDQPDEPGPKDTEQPITLSSDAKFLAQFLDDSIDEKPDLAKSPHLLQKLRRPDQVEPLSLLASEIMLKVAEARKENLVTCIPDDAFWDTAVLAGLSALKPSWVLKLLPSRLQTCTVKDGWIVCHPDDPFECTKKRADRAALARLIAAGESKGYLTMDDWAPYAIASPYDEVGLGQAVVGCLVHNDRSSAVLDWHALRIYGSLSPRQRSVLDGGNRLPLSEMTSSQMSIIAEIAYEDLGGVVAEPAGDGTAKTIENVLTDPTELLPNGIDPSGYMEGSTTVEDALYQVPKGDEEGITRGPQDLTDIALRMNDLPGAKPGQGDLGMLQLGKITRRSFRMTVGPRRYCQTFASDAYAPPGPEFTLKSLPDAVRKALDRAIEEVKHSVPFEIGGG